MAKFKVTRKQVPYSGGLKTSYTATLVKNREISAEEFSEVLTKRTRINPIATEIKFIFPGPYFDRLSIKKGCAFDFFFSVRKVFISLPLGAGVKDCCNFFLFSLCLAL